MQRKLVSFVAVATLAVSFPDAYSQQESLEYPLKATFLYKFADYIEWPTQPAEEAPFVVCVVGEDPFGELLNRAIQNAKVNGHRVASQRLAVAAREDNCQVMYVAGSDKQSITAALAVVKGKPVLTITDAARPADKHGIIHFVILDNRVRFEIDESAAAENNLAVSSKLLKLALSVKRKDGSK